MTNNNRKYHNNIKYKQNFKDIIITHVASSDNEQ